MVPEFTGLAATFFGNSRTAASLVLASSRLFALSGYAPRSQTPLEARIFIVYRLLTWTTFVLSLHSCIISTVASMGILHGKYDPIAGSATEFLLREFEYEFVSINWSILMTFLIIIVMVTLRVLLEFRLLSDPKRRIAAKFVLLTAVALMSHFVSYINSTICCWSNLFEMTLHMFQLVFSRTLREPTVMQVVSGVAACGSVYYGLGSALGYLSSPQPDEEKPKAE
jgi:hypothetical protein